MSFIELILFFKFVDEVSFFFYGKGGMRERRGVERERERIF